MIGNDGLPNLGAFGQPQPRLSHVPSPWTGNQQPFATTSQGRFATDCSLFHDGNNTDSVALQLDGIRAGLSIAQFGGGYVSLALDLPDAMAVDLSRDHDLRVMTTLASAPPQPMPGGGYLRLCVDDGGTLWQHTVPLFIQSGAQSVALGPGQILPDPLPFTPRKAWVDLVLTHVAGSAIGIESVTITRGPMPVL